MRIAFYGGCIININCFVVGKESKSYVGVGLITYITSYKVPRICVLIFAFFELIELDYIIPLYKRLFEITF